MTRHEPVTTRPQAPSLQAAPSKGTDAPGLRLAFVGPEAVARLLAPDFDLRRIGAETARLLVHPDHCDALIVTGDAVTPEDALSYAAIHGLPAVLWHEAGPLPEFAADCTAILTRNDAEIAAPGNVPVHNLPPLFQPQHTSPFVDRHTTVLGPIDAIHAPGPHADRAALRWLSAYGLRLHFGEEPWPDFYGYPAGAARAALLRRARVLVQDGADGTPRHLAQTQGIEAAACRAAVLHRGPLAEDDPRSGFAVQVADWAELRLALARLLADDGHWRRTVRRAWRSVQGRHRVRDVLPGLLNGAMDGAWRARTAAPIGRSGRGGAKALPFLVAYHKAKDAGPAERAVLLDYAAATTADIVVLPHSHDPAPPWLVVRPAADLGRIPDPRAVAIRRGAVADGLAAALLGQVASGGQVVWPRHARIAICDAAPA